MTSFLVLMYFHRLRLGRSIKASFITYKIADPEILSILIFIKWSGTSLTSRQKCKYLKNKKSF